MRTLMLIASFVMCSIFAHSQENLLEELSLNNKELDEIQLMSVNYSEEKALLRIDLMDETKVRQIRLLSSDRTLIKIKAVESDAKFVVFDMKGMARGKYFLQLMENKQKMVVKPILL